MPTVTGPVTIVRTVKRDATTAAASGGTSELMRVTAVAHGGWLCVEPLMDEVANQGLDSELVSEAQDATYTAFLARGPWRGAKTKTKVKTTAYTAFTVDQYCRVEGRVWVKVTTVPQRKKAEMATEEIAACDTDLARLDSELQGLLLPKDPDDERNAFIEIRAGTGGDESALFAADLLRMYTRYCENQGITHELISESLSELGGYKEVVLRLAGKRAYGQMRFESGGHRVQRVPATETQGRIHTSACTVAVMPEPDESQAIEINPADLRIDTYRASGAGGQHINKTDSAVRITHIPTGTVAECQDDRSQHRNRAKAMQVLSARIQEAERLKRESAEAAERKGLIGSGDRSDRIRTYNFPQGRITDHRINLTLYKLNSVMEGDLGEVIHQLNLARGAELMAELENANNG